jgi:hypothetical protein
LHEAGQEERPGRVARGVGKRFDDQDALGAAIDSDGASELPALDGARLGADVVDVVDVGLVVADGELQAATALPTDAARASASRIRLNIGGGSSVFAWASRVDASRGRGRPRPADDRQGSETTT